MSNFINLFSIEDRCSAHVRCEPCAVAVRAYPERVSPNLIDTAEDLFEACAVGWSTCEHGQTIEYRTLPVAALLGC